MGKGLGVRSLSVRLDGTILGQEGARIHAAEPTMSDLALIVFTSGSSGRPKGVMYSHAFIAHGSWSYGEDTGLEASSVALLKAPFASGNRRNSYG